MRKSYRRHGDSEASSSGQGLTELRVVKKVQEVGLLSGKELREHEESGHVVFDKRCISCVIGQMRRRQHKRIKHQSHSLSVDIKGPRQMAGDLSRFILVFAYKGEPERVIVEGEQLGKE